MSAFLWTLQILLAIHTAIGAVWKLASSEQVVIYLNNLPHEAWLGLAIVELLCSFALLIPIAYRPLGRAAPLAAGLIALEMVLFCGLHFATGGPRYGAILYWLIVAALCGLIAYGRLKLRPIT